MMLKNLRTFAPPPTPKIVDQKPQSVESTPVTPSTPKQSLSSLLITIADDFVNGGNIQSVDQRDKTTLSERADVEVENIHQEFPEAERRLMRTRIEEVDDQLKAAQSDIERATDRVIGLEQKLGPQPKKERAASLAVVAAVALYSFGIAVSIQGSFDSLDDDKVITWLYSILFGTAGGVLITWSILGLQGRAK